MGKRGGSSPQFDVKVSLLQWAMERSDKSVEDLSGKRGLENLEKWLIGDGKPTRLQLEAFSKATYTPFGYLVLSKPPDIQPSPIPHFRTTQSDDLTKRSINLEDTISIIEQRQEWVRDYLKETGAEPLGFVGSVSMNDDPVEVAEKIKTTLNLKKNWAAKYKKWEYAQKHLQQQIENTRMFLSANNIVQNNTSRKLDPKEFRGFVLVDNYAPFIFINKADIGAAQIFTLAHELAHVWIGESASFDLRYLAPARNKLEYVCNKIAAEFLVPTEEILSFWDQFAQSVDDPYKAVSNHFKVSRIVAARRALDTNRISKDVFNAFYDKYEQQTLAQKQQEELKKKQQKTNNGPTFDRTASPRIGKRLLHTIVTAVEEQKLLYHQAYYLTGLKSKSFDTIRNRILNSDGEKYVY